MVAMHTGELQAYHIEDSLINGLPVYRVKLSNAGMTVMLTNAGCSIVAIYVPDKHGDRKNIVAGFTHPGDYLKNPHYLGCTLGRYAGRIAGGRFVLAGRTVQLTLNEDKNHLHGGFENFSGKIWKLLPLTNTADHVAAKMRYVSPDGEEGYPGEMITEVEFRLHRSNRLEIIYYALTSRPCPVSLSNHSYFNLSGFADASVLNHNLQINSSHYLEKNKIDQPTGNKLPVQQTPLDFTKPKPVGQGIDQFPDDMGFNHTFVLRENNTPKMLNAAVLSEPVSGRVMTVYTDQPSLQLYTANYWNGQQPEGCHWPYHKHGAVALETQAFPDSPNHPDFPDTVLDPGEEYRSATILEFRL